MSAKKYELIICEKPSASEKVAGALAKESIKMESSGQARYYDIMRDGKEIIVVPAVGHLFGLRQKGKKSWTYPVFDVEWAPTHETNKDAGYAKQYLENIEKLAKGAGEFYVATDYDREGSVIGGNIIRFLCGREDAKRMKFSTLTKVDLVEAYENASPHLDFSQMEAGETRHILDFLWGINISRALSLAIKRATNKFRLLSSGRVQGPLMNILTEREREIRAFVPEKYYQIELHTEKKGQEIVALHENDFIKKREEAEAIIDKCKGKDVKVDKVEKKVYKHNPPVPFDLTTLQMESYKHFGYNPKQTLDIAQKLYDSALISYPRTSSQKLPEKLGLREIMEKLSQQRDYKKHADELLKKKDFTPNKGEKEDPAHPALHPTGETPGAYLNDGERNVYDLVVKRFLAIFGEPAVRESMNVVFDVSGEKFKVAGSRTLERNWYDLYDPYVKLEELTLPELKAGEILKQLALELLEKETQPLKRFSQASLLKMLEKLDIGTKATRAQIVANVFVRGYCKEIKGKSIMVTALGEKVVDTLAKYCPDIISVELTHQFEEEMEKIHDGKETKNKVVEDAKQTLTKILTAFKEKEYDIGLALKDGDIQKAREETGLGACPVCKDGELRIIKSQRTGKRFVGCSNYMHGCSNSYPLPQNGAIRPLGKNCEACGAPMVEVKARGRPLWKLCINMKCTSKSKVGT